MKRSPLARSRRLVRLLAGGGACVAVPILAFTLLRGQLPAETPANAESKPVRAALPAEPALPPTPPPIPTRATPALMAALQAQLQEAVRHAPARRAAVYVEDIGSGLTAAANPDQRFIAASLIKLPVMATVYRLWETKPELKTRTTRTWMEWMITVSDNRSTDHLIDLVNGPEEVTRFCADRGWDELKVRHAILNHRGRRGLNECTARQVGEFLAALDRRELVSEEADQEMWEVLCRSRKLQRIPAGIPDHPEVRVGNKTGTLSHVLHDSAIVRTPRTHFALCILLSRQRGEDPGNRFCQEVARRVFDALHGPLESGNESVAQAR